MYVAAQLPAHSPSTAAISRTALCLCAVGHAGVVAACELGTLVCEVREGPTEAALRDAMVPLEAELPDGDFPRRREHRAPIPE